MQVLTDHVLPEIQPLKERQILLLIIRVNLDQIQLLGKRFRWKKPETCPGCRGRRVWGHGFTLRYFQGFGEGLWIKRWRCPDCYGVHTARPHEYPVGSQYPQRLRLESVWPKSREASSLEQYRGKSSSIGGRPSSFKAVNMRIGHH